MSAPKLLVFAGSARKDSVNKKLAAHAAETARTAGAEVTHIDLNDFPAPVYHGDEETASGLPETMRRFKALVREHDALVIATPEYNGNIPPVIVNTLDWASRAEGEDRDNVFAGKYAAILAASPGGLGGIRVVPRLRAFLTDLGMFTVPGHASLPGAFQAFDADGALTNERTADQVSGLIDRLLGALR